MHPWLVYKRLLSKTHSVYEQSYISDYEKSLSQSSSEKH